MSNMVELSLFNREGIHIGVTVAAIDSVSWQLNRTGEARLFLPYSDPFCTPSRLALGNRVLLQFGNGLPAFGGVIDVPRNRTDAGVTFAVYTGDRILSWRVSNKIESFTAVAPGTIVRMLVDQANATKDTSIRIQNVYTGGAVRTEEYNYANLLDALMRLQRQSGEDFAVIPLVEGKRLVFELVWSEALGVDKSDRVAFVEGTNVETPLELSEQGPIASQVYQPGGGAGGTTWADRLVGEAYSAEAALNYGYREVAQVQTGIFDQATLDAIAAAALDEMDSPRAHMRLVAQDKAPARFYQYQVGDRCQVEAYLAHSDWRYSARIRVLGRLWTPANTCQLEVVEW